MTSKRCKATTKSGQPCVNMTWHGSPDYCLMHDPLDGAAELRRNGGDRGKVKLPAGAPSTPAQAKDGLALLIDRLNAAGAKPADLVSAYRVWIDAAALEHKVEPVAELAGIVLVNAGSYVVPQEIAEKYLPADVLEQCHGGKRSEQETPQDTPGQAQQPEPRGDDPTVRVDDLPKPTEDDLLAAEYDAIYGVAND